VNRGLAVESLDLDPADWDDFRRSSRGALADMIGFLETIRERPVWRQSPIDVLEHFDEDLPVSGRPLDDVLEDFKTFIEPYATGNLHPAFMGWVHGAGTPVGMLAEMLTAGLNMNCGGRNHIGIVLEQQIVQWMGRLFAFPGGASGLLVTGTSMANFLGVVVARQHRLGDESRRRGLAQGPQLCAYASSGVHGCVVQAMQMSGIGSDHLRFVPCDESGAMRVEALRALVQADRQSGFVPFLVIATAGSVDCGAIDPLDAIADFTAKEGLWFHVDGAFGALAVLSPELKPRVAGIERADSIAFDFHKWMHVPYDAGFLLVRDGDLHRRTFGSENRYLTRASEGLAAGAIWPCDLGPDLSRGCRALKTWFTFQVFGVERIGQVIAQTCQIARYLAERIEASARFVLRAQVRLNIVCFSFESDDPDRDNRQIVEALHLSGRAAPSITLLNGQAVIRCAIVNHRTRLSDIDAFLATIEDIVDDLGLARVAQAS